MRSALIDLGKALDELADTDVVGLPDQDVRDALPALLTAFNQISALVATVVASFDTATCPRPTRARPPPPGWSRSAA